MRALKLLDRCASNCILKKYGIVWVKDRDIKEGREKKGKNVVYVGEW